MKEIVFSEIKIKNNKKKEYISAEGEIKIIKTEI